jgi:hypothetical protein
MADRVRLFGCRFPRVPGVLAMSVTAAFCQTQNQAHSASDLGRQVLGASLDPTECYRVRNIRIHQPDVDFYLTDGYLIFGKPVNGAPVSAVFTSDTEGGDAEVVLLPPDRAERRTLASFTGSPNLDEHFTRAVFFFTDDTARSLAADLRSGQSAEKDTATGLLMADKWNLTVASLSGNLETRIIVDLLAKGPNRGFFEATMLGRTLGEFDIVHDARATEQIAAGKVTVHDGTAQWDTWTRFVSRDRRNMPEPAPEEEILSYNIDASMDSALFMRCVTHIRIRATVDSREVLPFELNTAMRVISAKVDGAAAEAYQHESLRAGLVQNSGDALLLVVPPRALEAGTLHDVEIVHELFTKAKCSKIPVIRFIRCGREVHGIPRAVRNSLPTTSRFTIRPVSILFPPAL